MVESPKQGGSPQGLGGWKHAGLREMQKSAVAAKRNHPPQPEFQNLPFGASFYLFSNTYKKFESLFFKRVKILLTFEPLCINNFNFRITISKSKKSFVLY